MLNKQSAYFTKKISFVGHKLLSSPFNPISYVMIKKTIRLLLLCFALFQGNLIFAQAGDYAFSASSATFTPLGATATTVPALLGDFGEADVPIGFDFEFEGVLYDTVSAASDGFLSFVKGAASTGGNDLDNGSAVRRPLVAPLWDDHDGSAAASQAAYTVTGSAPNRVFTFEWLNWEWSWNSTDSVVSFQVKLYETTNIVEFAYRWECSTCITGPDASIGLSGSSTFLSLTGLGTGTVTASNTTEDNSIDTVVTDQVFTFTPPACPSPSFDSVNKIRTDSATVYFTSLGSGPFYINYGPTGFAQGAAGSDYDTVMTSPFVLHGLLDDTDYDFYIQSDCGANGTSLWKGPFSFTTLPSCPAPVFSSFTNISTDSITVNWTSGGSAGPWYIYWGPTGFNQASASASLDTSSTTSFTAYGLTAGTSYTFYIKEDCGSGDTSRYAGPYNQTTIYAPPYLETFAGGYPGPDYFERAGSIGNPTNFGTSTSSDWRDEGFANSGSSGAAGINIWGSSKDEWFIGPSIDLGDGTIPYQLELDVAVTNWLSTAADAMGADDSVKVVISTDNGQTWNNSNAIYTFTVADNIPNGAGAHYVINLSGYTGVVRFGFYAESTSSNQDYDFFIDNIEVVAVPPCPAATFPSATVYGLDSVMLNWKGTAGGYDIEYGLAPLTIGSGMTLAVTDTFAVLQGLVNGITYDFYVRANCGTSGTSPYVSSSFTTPCTPKVAPFLETFDGTSWGVGSSSGVNDSIDPCWTRNSETGYKWSVYNGTTASGSTGPDADHTGGGNFLFTEASNSSPSQAILVSPYIDVSGLTTPYVNFWYHRYGSVSDMGDMTVEINDGSGWVTVLTQTGTDQASGSDPFKELGTNISSFGDTIRVRFVATAKATFEGDMAIDDFEVKEAPSCPPILNLGANNIVDTAATFVWGASANATSYQVWFGPQGFFQGTQTTGGAMVIAPYDSLLVDTLSDLTCYEFLVRGICAPGDSSSWAGPYSFCTPPSCPAPTNLGVDPLSLILTSADVYWTSGGASDFNVEYGVAGFTQGAGTMVNATNDTLSLSSLSAGTEYEFYVRDSCGAGDVSLWEGPFSFVTPFSTNYLEDFTMSSPLGWTEAYGRLTSNTVFTSTTSSSWGSGIFANVGSNNAQLVNIYSDDEYEWLISPSIYLDPAITNLQVELDVAVTEWWDVVQGYLGADDTLALVISTDNGATWSSSNIMWYADASDTLDVAGEHIILPLTGYSGYVKFGIYAGSANDDPEDNELFVDNFEVRTPRACPFPTGLTVSDIGTDSALVSWTEGSPGFINAEVIYTVGNQPASAGTIVNSTNDSIVITGLTGATEYCVYVVEECVNGFSDTIGPVCFTTACLPFTAPYFEDFEGATASCWSNALVTGTKEWTIATGSSGGTVNSAYSGNLNARFTSSSGGPHITKYVSPIIDVSSLASAELTFWYAQEDWAGDQNYLNVYYRDNAQAAWVHIWGDSTNVTAWTQGVVTIPSNSSTLEIAFEGVDLYGRANVIDDVSINVAGATTCPSPSGLAVANISCDSVELSWISDTANTPSVLEYGPKGYTPGSGTLVTGISSPYILSGLSYNTEYDFYVADSCGVTLTTISGPFTFKTDSVGSVMASFIYIQSDTTLNDATVDFDASASTGDGLTYDWDFGNGSTGTGMNATGTYTANGTVSVKLTITDRCGNTDDTTITVVVSHISISENLYNVGIDVYPNPSNGNFKVNISGENSAYAIEVTDLSGKVVYKNANLKGGEEQEVNLGNVASGVYLIRISGNGLNATQRIMID